MTTVKTILCPLDFSETGRHALGHAADLARTLGAGPGLFAQVAFYF